MCGVFVLGPCFSGVALGTVSVFGNHLLKKRGLVPKLYNFVHAQLN